MSLLPTIVNWYGGKQKLARQIISIMPEHQHYVEVFMGSAAVFFNKSKAPRNCINDVNENLTNLFIQVRDNFDELAEKAYWTLYSRKQYKSFVELYNNNFNNCNSIDRALAYFFLVRANFNSQIGTGFSASVDCNSANFNLNLIERLKLAREKLDGVVIENRQYYEIIEKYDRKESLIYLDPPYWVADHVKWYYENRFDERQHILLASKLAKCKANWILSYDDIPEIVDYYKEFNLNRLSVKYVGGHKATTRKVSELLITNFVHKKPQLDIFDETIDSEFVDDDERTEAEKYVELKHEKEYAEKLKKEKNEPSRPNIKSTSEQQDFFS
jgi:DNA adenine methylase